MATGNGNDLVRVAGPRRWRVGGMVWNQSIRARIVPWHRVRATLRRGRKEEPSGHRRQSHEPTIASAGAIRLRVQENARRYCLFCAVAVRARGRDGREIEGLGDLETNAELWHAARAHFQPRLARRNPALPFRISVVAEIWRDAERFQRRLAKLVQTREIRRATDARGWQRWRRRRNRHR